MAGRFDGKVVIVRGAASVSVRRPPAASRLKTRALSRSIATKPGSRTSRNRCLLTAFSRIRRVSDAAAVDAMVKAAADRFGRLDVLANNAGVHEGGEPKDITNEQWRRVMATDLDGVFFGCRAALPHLEKTKGSIVNTPSVSGTGGDWAMSPYNAAKGGVVNLTRALAMDLAEGRAQEDHCRPRDPIQRKLRDRRSRDVPHGCKIGLEGAVSKVYDSIYASGRGNNWVKKPCAQRRP